MKKNLRLYKMKDNMQFLLLSILPINVIFWKHHQIDIFRRCKVMRED